MKFWDRIVSARAASSTPLSGESAVGPGGSAHFITVSPTLVLGWLDGVELKSIVVKIDGKAAAIVSGDQAAAAVIDNLPVSRSGFFCVHPGLAETLGRPMGVEVLDRQSKRLLGHARFEPARPEFLGSIDVLTRETVSGWVASTHTMIPVVIDVIVDGVTRASRVVASQERADVEAAGIWSGRHAFSIELAPIGKQVRPRQVEIVEHSTGRAILTRVFEETDVTYIGHFDEVSHQVISGWIAVEGNDSPVVFDIAVEGVTYGSKIKAQSLREDLVEAGIGKGLHGFRIVASSLRFPDSGGRVELIHPSTGQVMLSAEMILPGTEADGQAGVAQVDVPYRDSQDSDAVSLGRSTPFAGLATEVLLSADRRRLIVYAIFATPGSDAEEAPFVPDSLTVLRDGVAVEPILFGDPVLETEGRRFFRAEGLCIFGHGEEVDIRLHYRQTEIFSSSIETHPRSAGRIERHSDDILRGWAVDFASPNKPASLDLYVNGVFVKSGFAGVSRPDVTAVHGYPPNTGFGIPFDVSEFPYPQVRVSVRVSGTEDDLNNKVPVFAPLKGAMGATDGLARPRWTLPTPPPTTIVVPIYNAPDETEACILSLLRTVPLQSGQYRILLSDDASPDPRIGGLLDRYENRHGVTILRHPTNLGYTRNINAAIRAVPDGDVVLLNSDTEVSTRWLEKMQRSAYRHRMIGTVTAVSDNAGAFSVPNRNEKNAVPRWLDRDDYARLVSLASAHVNPTVPTGSGFCLYIKRGVFDAIGLFDDVAFERGYGEENDFCMRAQYAGWKNVVAEDVLVYHERSASFLESKSELMARAGELIPQMYPEYPRAVYQAFAARSAMSKARYRIQRDILRASNAPKPRIAFVIGVESGGTPQTNMDLMSSIQDAFSPFLLLCSMETLRLYEITGSTRILREEIALVDPVSPVAHDSNAYAEAVSHLLQQYEIEILHVRHIGRHGLSLIPIAKRLTIPVIFSLHDFYTVCPNVKLLDGDGNYCGGRCTTGSDKDCSVELWAQGTTPPLKHRWIKNWQPRFKQVLGECDMLITTSPYARQVIQNVYGLEDVPFEVIPHGRSFGDFYSHNQLPSSTGRLRVLVPGYLTESKGLELIKAMKALDAEYLIELHFLGSAPEDLGDYGVVHGSYTRDDFHRHVEKIRPHVGLVMSIWPETYSHTLTELWSCGVPVVTSPLGALGERMAKHGAGWIIDDLTPEALYAALLEVRRGTDINAKLDAVRTWQASYGTDYSAEVMARQYMTIYRRALLQRIQPAAKLASVWVMSLNPSRDRTGSMPTEHLNDTFAEILGDSPLDVSRMPVGALNLLDELEAPAVLVLQYDGTLGVPMETIRSFAASKPGVPIVLDLLPNVPDADSEPSGWRSVRTALAGLADYVVAPEVLKAYEPYISDADLSASSEDMSHVGDALLSVADKTHWTSDSHLRRLDEEIHAGASKHVVAHNRKFVDAHFELIDWSALLATAGGRVQGMTSIVIPVYNGFALTQAFIRSIFNQETQGDFEIIIVDNGCKPEVGNRLRAMAQAYDRVRVVATGTNLMFSVGCNFGASFSRGEYILFLNNDMEAISPNWLNVLMEPLKVDPNIGIVGGKLLFPDRTVQHAGIVFGTISKFPYHLYKDASATAPGVKSSRMFQAVTGACTGIRASDWIKLRGFSPVFVNGSEDIDFCLRMSRTLQRRILYVPEAELIHHESKTPGRGRFSMQNRRIFVDLWGDAVQPDDHRYYRQDAIRISGYTTSDHAIEPQFRAISPVLIA